MEKKFQLTKKYWKQFKIRHWDPQIATVIERPFKSPLISESELFEGLVFCRQNIHTADSRSGVSFYVGSEKVRAIEGWLPKAQDKNLESYRRRVSRKAGNKGYCLDVTDIQRFFKPEFWNRLRSFLTPIFESVGRPVGSCSSHLFLGNYKETPFGVHRDPANIFIFQLRGQKTIRHWNENAASYTELRDDYRDYIEESEVLEANAGDILYLPSSRWHLSAADSDLSYSVSLSLGHNPYPMEEVFGKILADKWRKNAGESERDPLLPNSLEKQVSRARKVLRHSFSENVSERQLVRAMAERMTSYGFVELPQRTPKPIKFGDKTTYRANTFKIASQRVGHVLVVSANGHSFEIPYNKFADKIIENLNNGKPVKAQSKDDDHRLARIVFRNLLKIGAIC